MNSPYYQRSQWSQLQLLRQAAPFAKALADYIGPIWDGFAKPTDQDTADFARNLLYSPWGELFRRIDGFLAVVRGVLAPLLTATEAEAAANALWEANNWAYVRVRNHVQDNQDYYLQRYLAYLSERTGNAAIVTLAAEVLPTVELDPVWAEVGFDVERAFVDRQQVVIPAVRAITGADLTDFLHAEAKAGRGTLDPRAVAAEPFELDVPADGVHLEVAPGICELPELPAEPSGREVCCGCGCGLPAEQRPAEQPPAERAAQPIGSADTTVAS